VVSRCDRVGAPQINRGRSLHALPALSRRLDVRTAVVGVVAPAALLAGVAWASYGAGVRARVATDARLEAMLHDRPADAAALVQQMEANRAFAREIEQAPWFTDQATGREAASVTVWVK
jgi:hypothetical protein